MNEEKLWESYNNLLMSNDIDRVRKLITRYELFKKTLDKKHPMEIPDWVYY